MDKIKLGSKTAKDGFKNEFFVVNEFNSWKKSELSRAWLIEMGYILDEIESVKDTKIKGSFKADVQILVEIKFKNLLDIQNLQVKLVGNLQGFNQIDKRWLNSYNELWNFNDEILEILKYFTGENKPFIVDSRDKRRMFFDEFSKIDQDKIINFFTKNKTLILTDILKGRGKFTSEWFLVILKMDELKWALKNINEVINIYDGEVVISPKGSLKIGKITMQRKGGDGGRKTANMLQFKINPCELFNIK